VFHLDSFDRRSFHPISWAPADESQVPEEELRQEYRGGGLRRQRRGRLHRQSQVEARRQFQDATDQDIERLVREKWEAIERAQRDDQALADQLRATRVQPVPSGQQAPDARPSLVPLSLDAQPPWLAPGPGVDVAGAVLMPGALDGLAQDEEALLLLLLADL